MKFSILICSLINRYSYLNRLLCKLKSQIKNYDNIEILINIDDGIKSIGQKRNELLEKAKGEYIAFIDDDDLVDKKYIDNIMGILSKTDVDCIGFCGHMIIDNRNKHKFIHSIKYKKWFKKNGIFYRCPNHLNPIKREYAIKVKFDQIDMGEDKDYSEKIIKFLKKEKFIDQIMYIYLYNSRKNRRKLPARLSKNKKIIKDNGFGIYTIEDLYIKENNSESSLRHKNTNKNRNNIKKLQDIKKLNRRKRS